MLERVLVFIIVYTIWWASLSWSMEVASNIKQGGKAHWNEFSQYLPGVLMTVFGMAYVAWALAGRILGS